MIKLLAASRPDDDRVAGLNLFGQFIGSWDIEATFWDHDGNVTAERAGEWHFGWVLQGRAIQDVLISPPLPAPIPLARDCDLYLDPGSLFLLSVVPNAGTWTVRYPLPDDIRLMSVRVSMQVLHLQTFGPLGFDLTNALRWLLGY